MESKDITEFRKTWTGEINNKISKLGSETVEALVDHSSRKAWESKDVGCNKCSDLQSECRPRPSSSDIVARYGVHSDSNNKTSQKRSKNELDCRLEESTNKYKKDTNSLLKLQNKQQSTTGGILEEENTENLLEILISDIDETVSLPFFDLELPREIAINIFRFLSMMDLSNCAQVNKQWKFLAEDDLLWYDICLKCGFETNASCALDRKDWKAIVKDCISKEKSFKKNWKERICQISELEYEKGNIATLLDIRVLNRDDNNQSVSLFMRLV